MRKMFITHKHHHHHHHLMCDPIRPAGEIRCLPFCPSLMVTLIYGVCSPKFDINKFYRRVLRPENDEDDDDRELFVSEQQFRALSKDLQELWSEVRSCHLMPAWTVSSLVSATLFHRDDDYGDDTTDEIGLTTTRMMIDRSARRCTASGASRVCPSSSRHRPLQSRSPCTS
jgi:hypothetical protein